MGLFKLLLIIGIVFTVGVIFLSYTQKKEKFDQKTMSEQKFELALFHAPWCGHCKKYLESGNFDVISSKLPSVVALKKYNVDVDTEVAAKYKINALPTILLIDTTTGKVVKEFDGDRNKVEDLVGFAKKFSSQNV
jgi:thioredoxin-like negative regulator of GroEL